jgi:hypothetical protein
MPQHKQFQNSPKVMAQVEKNQLRCNLHPARPHALLRPATRRLHTVTQTALGRIAYAIPFTRNA